MRDRIIERWLESDRRAEAERKKRVYYLSIEYLIGRLLFDTLTNLGLIEAIREALAGFEIDLEHLRTLESDAGLGTGGLGRLAACYLDSTASLGVPAHGYGIRYEHGLFRQQFTNGWQSELPDDWLANGNPWEFARSELAYPVRFGGMVEYIGGDGDTARGIWYPAETVDAVASRLREHNYEIRPVLQEIFSSSEFYSEQVMRSQIKSPVQFLIQTAKLLEAPLPSPNIAQNAMRQMGQILFAPPSVKGWDGGRAWISTSTLLFRYNFANYLINGDAMSPESNPGKERAADFGFRRGLALDADIRRDPIEVSKLIPAALRNKPKELVAHLSTRLFQAKAAAKEANAFVQYLEARSPDTGDETMRGLLHLMMSTPQFQLT